MSVASLDSIYRKVLATGGKEQNSMYPPRIYDEHFNTTSNWILDEIVKMYPDSHSVSAIANPFLVSVELPVVNGIVKFKDNFRNILGVAINVTEDKSKDCGCKDDAIYYDNDPLQDSEKKKLTKLERAKCIQYDVDILDVDEFGKRTRHLYKYPTYKNAIATVKKSEASTHTEIKVCPFDVSYVEVTYLKRIKEYRYGYKELPDHTFVFDKNTTEESEWDDTAMQYLLKGVTSLYSAYIRDPEIQNWNEVIKKVGLF